MKGEQVAYQFGRAVKSNYDALFLMLTAKLGIYTFQVFSIPDDISSFDASVGAVAGFTGALCGVITLWGGTVRAFSRYHRRKIERDADEYPLEFASSVFIDDKDGLQFLLDKTRSSRRKRWGTFLKAHDDSGRAVIDNIMDIGQCEDEGLIEGVGKRRPYLNLWQAQEDGYSGHHHYHRDLLPGVFGGTNYAIELNDRTNPDNWISLITFNRSDGPEILAYNSRNVYIPSESKREFFPATAKRMNAYLRTYAMQH